MEQSQAIERLIHDNSSNEAFGYIQCVFPANSRYLFKICYYQELPLAWVVSESIQLYMLDPNNMSSSLLQDSSLVFTGLRSPTLGQLDMSMILTDKVCNLIPKVYMVFEGPLSRLDSKLILRITQYFDTAKDISSFQRTNKRFLSIIKSDQVWRSVKLNYKFHACGSLDSDDAEWERYQEHYGLPAFNVLR